MTHRVQPAAPANLRNGLKWRDGRPRFEPSPAARAVGVRGVDLRRADGTWMDRGEAIGAADDRALWASAVRRAHTGGEAALAELRQVLGELAAPADAQARHKRALVQDLVDAARALVEGRDAAMGVRLRGRPRTVDAMIDGYLADPHVEISAATRAAYRSQAKAIRSTFGDRLAGELTRGQVHTWYREMLGAGISPSLANLRVAALGTFYKWAGLQDWITVSPVTKLNLASAPGRLVFWTPEEERTFVAFCDAKGWPDVGDGITVCLWTGANITDVCQASLQDLSGPTWRYARSKTRRRGGGQALPAVTPAVAARVERRRKAVVTAASGRFLLRPVSGGAHDTGSFYERFKSARAAALTAGAVPATLADKRVQDTRDTCITRLVDAGVPITRIWSWSGHAPKDAERIIRKHYASLLDAGALEMGAQLEAWASKNGFPLKGTA